MLLHHISFFSIMVVGATLVSTVLARPLFNEKEVPETMDDLLAIQHALQANLERCRKATVSVTDGKGSGSGVVVSKDGLVMTAAHVTGAVGKEFTVIFEAGREVKARSLGLDSRTDSALLQITDKGEYDFVAVDRNKKEDMTTQLGDWAYSVAHPGGYDKERGSVVRLGRVVRMADRPPTFQTDGTLIGGDSGGPLFNMKGVLIGIHSRVGAVLDQNNSVATYDFFAIEDGQEKTKWERMLAGEFIGEGPFAQKPTVTKAYMGLAVKEVGERLLIDEIDKQSPAGKANIKVGDVIVSINGKSIKKKTELSEFMRTQAAGSELELVVLREGKEERFKFSLGKQ